jgi:hypothetical protein
MRLFVTILLLLITTLSLPLRAGEEFCGIQNNTFQAGESITYKVFYTLAKVYVGAGEATFNTSLEQVNGKTVYHVTGEGKTYSFYDNFFKVRDKYESFIDTGTMQPLKFIRNVDEGGYKIYENITFNKAVNTAITTKGVFKVPSCVQDVISSIYYARNIDFGRMKPNDKIPFTLFLDNQLYDIYVRYLGKEVIRTKYGKFRAIKFRPLLIKGTIFEGGEKMTVWVTDDMNHLPIRVESPITVGSVIVDMINFKNRRHPMTSLLDVN